MPDWPDPADKPLLSVAELAALLRQPVSTTYSQVSAGAYPTIPVSERRVKIPTAKLYAVLGIEVKADTRLRTMKVGRGEYSAPVRRVRAALLGRRETQPRPGAASHARTASK